MSSKSFSVVFVVVSELMSLSESSPNISRSMRVFIDYNTDDARRKQRRGVVVVEPLVFVMIVSTKAVTVTKSFFYTRTGGGFPFEKTKYA